jgi:lipopolysaccharide/colanic/teichoic acid biosynthesis glycosyltransferase
MLYESAKRTIDIIMAIILTVVFSPFLIVIPIAIVLDSPGPVFADIPGRVGKNKKIFRMYKFRTMIVNAHRLLREDPKFKELYEEYKKGSYKLKKDPRITQVGHFLRRFSLDELPQVFNILKGEMSLVGPRAYYPDELEHQQKIYPETKEYVMEIMKTKPGITGHWQVTGRSEVNFDKRVRMDAEYVKEHSILQDLIIIAKTPWAMVSGRGAL